MSTSIAVSQAQKLATKFEVDGDPKELVSILKNTAFKGNVSDAQFSAFMIVAGQYNLNPFTKEIHAFSSGGAIVPIVGVDGWMKIMNEHPQFDGLEFEQNDESCTCKIYRKDRGRPIVITEYLAECKKSTDPWKNWPMRMLRHKAMIQCARLAFGFSGIHDEDEADRILESGAKNITPQTQTIDSDLQAKKDEIEALTASGDWDVVRAHLSANFTKEERATLGSEWMATLKSDCDSAASNKTIDGTATVIENVEAEVMPDDGLLI